MGRWCWDGDIRGSIELCLHRQGAGKATESMKVHEQDVETMYILGTGVRTV
jgi:hypothetical protein